MAGSWSASPSETKCALVEDALGERVRLDFHFLRPAHVRSLLPDAGREVVEVIQRRSDAASVEVQTDRADTFATTRSAPA